MDIELSFPGGRGSSMRIDVDKDAVINSSILATKAFVAKCRSDPLCDHMLPWVDVMFRPMDMLSLRSDLGSSIESFPGIPSDGGPVFEGFSQEHLDMLGRPVLKSFLPDGADKNRDFVGKVVSIDHDENSGGVMFEILYEDGDREDIPIDELRDLFQAYADKIFRKSQTVGANPQVQSRSGLVEHAVPVNSKCLCSPTAARKAVSDARRDGKVPVFIQDNPKIAGTKSYWEYYEHYKSVSSFDAFDALCKDKAAYHGQRAFRGRVVDMDPVVISKATKSDLTNDYKHGYLSFADRPNLSAGSGLVSKFLSSDDVQSLAQANVHREYDSSDVELFAAAKSWWSTSVFNSAPLSPSLVEIPAWFALACYHKSEVWVEGMQEPISLMGAIKSPEWPKWKEAIEKEIIGLLMMDLWKEVPRDSVPEGQRVNSGHFYLKLRP